MDHILRLCDIVKTDFVRGENCSVYDTQGKQYVDFESGCWCTALGHNHPRIQQVMKTQLDNIMHLGTRYPNDIAEEAAIDILDLVGMPDGKCLFLSSGSEAVEFAVQAARRVTGKPLLLTFSRSYLGAYGSAGKKSAEEWHVVDWSECAHAGQRDWWTGIPFEDIGGFAFEPGGSGIESVKFPSTKLVEDLVRRIKHAGGLVVANEITTGIGRTGKWFGFQHYDIQPDIVAIGKGLGNGYPVSAIAMNAEIAEQLEHSGVHYAQSHQNDPLGCAVAREVLTILREEQLIERGNAIGEFFLQGLKRLEEKHAIVKEARGRGMLLALEFLPHERFSDATAYRALFEHGFLVDYRPDRNFLRFDPALTIKKDDITRLLECLDSILETAS